MRIYFFITMIGLAGIMNISKAQDEVDDPVPESIDFSDIGIELEHFATVPNVSGHDLARINLLKELPDSSGRLAVNDLNGALHFIDKEEGAVTEFLDLASNFDNFWPYSGKGMGFGGVAFHPEFEDNGIFYTTHSEIYEEWPEADFPLLDGPTEVQWVLTRWTTTSDQEFDGTHEEMIRWDFNTTIHGVQDITFNPLAADTSHDDYGMLYICVGDGGASSSAYFPDNYQTLESHTGTIFRIDPEGSNSVNGTYGIPEENPFVDSTNAIGELWAYGFRNPHRLLFDKRSDGEVLMATDIGELNLEEINRIIKGGNYGWNEREGTFQYIRDMGRTPVYDLEEEGDYIYPVAQYDHDEGADGATAINTGYVWRAENNPELEGQLFSGDIPSGIIYHVPVDSLQLGRQYPLMKANLIYNSERTDFYDISNSQRPDIKFGWDHEGEVYFLTKADGKIHKIADVVSMEEWDDGGDDGNDGDDQEPTSIVNSEKKHDKVYPTSPSANLKIKLIDDARVKMVNMQGKTIWDLKLRKGDYIIPIDNIEKGIYVVTVSRDDYTYTEKIVH